MVISCQSDYSKSHVPDNCVKCRDEKDTFLDLYENVSHRNSERTFIKCVSHVTGKAVPLRAKFCVAGI